MPYPASIFGAIAISHHSPAVCEESSAFCERLGCLEKLQELTQGVLLGNIARKMNAWQLATCKRANTEL